MSYQQTDYSSSRTGSAWSDDLGGGYSWMSDDSAESSAWPSFARPDEHDRRLANAIRGLPPVPDEPLPTYPPGPFAAWNRGPSDRSDLDRAAAGRHVADLDVPGLQDRGREPSSRALSAATITPDEFDTNHGLPAIKDPIATKERASRNADPRTTSAGSRSGTRTGADHRARPSDRRAVPARGRSAPSRGTRGTARTSRRSKRQPVRLAIVTAVVIIAAVAAILVVTSLQKPSSNSNSGAGSKPHTPGQSTGPTPSASAGKWGYIGTRATDPTPLTVRELFPRGFTAGVYIHAAIMEVGHDCRAALIGGALQAAIKRAGCSQVLRASYVARLDNAMATIGVFNLANSTVASNVAQHSGPSAFVAPAASKNGVTSKIGQGTGLEEAVVKGHYLVLVWAENIGLTPPKTKAQRQHLTDFMNTLVQQTVNSALSYRMVEGKPQSG